MEKQARDAALPPLSPQTPEVEASAALTKFLIAPIMGVWGEGDTRIIP